MTREAHKPDVSGSSRLLVAISLILAAVLPNLNSLSAFFVGDDFDFMLHVRELSHAAEVLGLKYWGEWEPVWWLSFYLDFKWWGLWPVGYHATNIVWLALCVLLLYGLVRELWPDAALAPWAAALLFATHPLHDEAVTYIAARGHPISAGLTLLALWLYARWRRPDVTALGRTALLLGSLLSAFLAASAKEIALLIPLWILVLEVCVLGQFRLGAIVPAARRAALFLLPAASYIALRWHQVGLDSSKLAGPDRGLLDLFLSLADGLPGYSLIGGIPLPFAFVSRDVIEQARPLGGLVAGATLLVPAVLIVRQLRRDGRVSRALGMFTLGIAIVLIALAPVFWADLSFKRRYFFTPSIGTSLMAAVGIQWLATRRDRLAKTLLVVLVLGGALGLVQRNELYRKAGGITRNLMQTVRGTPLDHRVPARSVQRSRIVLLSVPRYTGGDSLSGAYTLLGNDAYSALDVAGVRPWQLTTGLRCYFADDYRSDAVLDDQGGLELNVSFRTHRAYEFARDRDARRDPAGYPARADLAIALDSADDETRQLRYRAKLSSLFREDRYRQLYVYDDGVFRRLPR